MTIRSSIQGITRRPTTSMSAANATTFESVTASTLMMSHAPTAVLPAPPSAPAKAGSSTSVTTITRSSTISQPTAIWPSCELSMPRSSSALSSTTVLATDSASPNTSPGPQSHPSSHARPIPMSVANAICPMAPGMAMALTASSSFIEKCNPTPNIRRITPSSASCSARLWSATKPGVNGPATTPAIR